MINKHVRPFISILLFILAMGPLTLAADQSTNDQKALKDANKDKALVYFICQRSSLFNSINVFDGNKVLTVIKKDSYNYAYLDPGVHFLWWSGLVGNQFEFIPGQVYYLDLSDLCPSLLEESDGIELLDKVKDYRTPDQTDLDQAQKFLAKCYTKTVDRENKLQLKPIGVPSLQQTQPNPDGTGMQIPIYTEIKLQPVENISTAYNQNDDVVWFKIAEDILVNNKIAFKSGTLVKGYIRSSKAASGFGMSGLLDVVIPAVVAVDGQTVPVFGRILTSGISGEQKSLMMTVTFGLLWGAMTKGKNAIELCGASLTVWTRNEVWMNDNPDNSTPINNSTAEGLTAKPVNVKIAWLNRKVSYIKVRLIGSKESKEIKEVMIGGNKFCSSLDGKNAVNLRKVKKEEWEATFLAWDIIRYIDFNDPANKLTLHGKFADEQPFVAELQVNVVAEEKDEEKKGEQGNNRS